MSKLPSPPVPKDGDSWFNRSWEKIKFKGAMRGIPNSLGLAVLNNYLSMASTAEVSFRDRTNREAHRLMLLIQIYREEHGGSLPANLGLLKAGVASFPVDFYAGGPFHYSSSRRIFWSVGSNGVDDGGTSGTNRFTGPDMVWAIP